MLVPLVLVVAGRLSARLPVAARMATRDAARHRARSVPTVAAIMAGAIALTAFSIGLASDTEQSIRDYQPQQPAGQGAIYVASDVSVLAPDAVDPALEDAEELVRGLTPDLVSTRLGQVTTPFDPKNPTAPAPFVAAVKPGCTVDRAVTDSQPDQQSGRPVCQVARHQRAAQHRRPPGRRHHPSAALVPIGRGPGRQRRDRRHRRHPDLDGRHGDARQWHCHHQPEHRHRRVTEGHP